MTDQDPPASPAIEIRNLSVTLNSTPVLHNISLSIARGEYLSLIGPNGAGKTTLLRALLGMGNYLGSVKINGIECREQAGRALAREVGYVPQTHDIEFPLTVHDFVMMGRYPYLSPLSPAQKSDEEAVDRALQMTGTTPLRTRTLRTLSGGERQRVYIAAALAQQTPVMLLDEPATFLDWRHQADIMALLKKINTDCGVTIVAVNHDLNSATHWSDRIAALKNGNLVALDTPEVLMQPDRLEDFFDTPFVRQELLTPRF